MTRMDYTAHHHNEQTATVTRIGKMETGEAFRVKGPRDRKGHVVIVRADGTAACTCRVHVHEGDCKHTLPAIRAAA